MIFIECMTMVVASFSDVLFSYVGLIKCIKMLKFVSNLMTVKQLFQMA